MKARRLSDDELASLLRRLSVLRARSLGASDLSDEDHDALERDLADLRDGMGRPKPWPRGD